MAHSRPSPGARQATAAGPEPTGIAERSIGGSTALAVIDLGKHFRSGLTRRRRRGIEGVSFSVQAGEIYALLGHNGAGKTTTINCILDLCHAETGEVAIFGADHRNAQARKRVGYLPERPYFFDHLTGRELLHFYGRLLDVAKADLQDRTAAVLARVGMSAHADVRMSKMSKGMLQRIGIAQAILGDADLLILDEPMSGLDPLGRREVRELLLGLKAAGKTILLSSHIVPDVEMLADMVGILRHGRLVRTCSRAELASDAAYLVNVACGGDLPQNWPAWLADSWLPLAGGLARIEAPDTARLREVLEYCREGGVIVHSVETRDSGLENLFMSLHEKTEVPQ